MWICLKNVLQKLDNSWEATAYNKYGLVMEEFNKMTGTFRHRSVDDWMRPTPWQTGEHPIAKNSDKMVKNILIVSILRKSKLNKVKFK